MRSRKLKQGSDGLLNGQCDNNQTGGRRQRPNARFLLSVAAGTLLMVWITVTAHRSRSPSGQGTGWGLSRLWGETWSVSSKSGDGRSGGPAGARKDKRSTGKKKSRHHRHSNEDEIPVCTRSPLEQRQAYPMYGCAELEEMLEGKTEFLGQGYWRDVRLAEYGGQLVAVKTLRDTQEETRRNKERHRWEAAALEAVKGHPNIVHLLGLCECDVVTEYFPTYMDNLLLKGASHAPLANLSDRRIIGMALDAARGLQALHEVPGGPVVHADLQPRQLLIDENGVVKVNDLNRCRFMGRDVDGNPCPFRINKGNGVWRSPEEYSGEPQTEKLDIYSMGMIFWSMYGREPPFERDDTYKERVLQGERPRVDPSWHEGFVQLFQDMWAGEARERPDAEEVVVRLETMLAELPTES